MTRGRRRDRSLAASLPLIVICLAVAGCSSFSSASNQAAAVPPNSATAAASQPAGPDPDLMPYPQQSLIDVFPRVDGAPGGCHASSSEHLYPSGSALFATGWSSCQRRASRFGTAGRCSAGRRSGAGEYRPVRLPSLPKAIAVRSVHRKTHLAVTVVHLGPKPNWARRRFSAGEGPVKLMPQEIEHKYLVRLEIWKPSEPGVLYRQGYLSTAEERVVRVRIAGALAFLTVKGPAHGITRLELEYPIPMADAAMMLDLLCERPVIEKTRYRRIVCRKNMVDRCLSRRQYRPRRCRGGSRKQIRADRAAALARA